MIELNIVAVDRRYIALLINYLRQNKLIYLVHDRIHAPDPLGLILGFELLGDLIHPHVFGKHIITKSASILIDLMKVIGQLTGHEQGGVISVAM